ncbi:MAG TPA: LytTR family DNA-binding domain-containing protein [Gemmatimonadales bacterium]|nr:LytTR family DNA-binding domain-containing protein [Gemmatimonadales bacterium]
MTIRCLVVDDEALGRKRVVSLLETIPDAELVGECGDGVSAIRAIEELMPDLVFLDVQMPEVDGFGVLASIPQPPAPAIVFVTAYDTYALQAFEVHAQDYLLKPVDPDRFRAAFRRVAERVHADRAGGAAQRLTALLVDVERDRSRKTRWPIKTGGRIFFLSIAEIDWIEAADNHVRIHAGKDVHVMRRTMQAIEEALPADQFVRIHRSTIINVERIKEIQPWFTGEYLVLLDDGTRLPTSRSHRARLESLMK